MTKGVGNLLLTHHIAACSFYPSNTHNFYAWMSAREKMQMGKKSQKDPPTHPVRMEQVDGKIKDMG